MKLLSPFYNLLSLTAIILFLPSVFFGQQSFDIHLHKTYFIIGIGQFLKLNAFILLALWMVYKLSENVLHSKVLTKIHVITSVLSMLLISTAVYWGKFTIWTPGANYVEPVTSSSSMRMVYIHFALLIIVLAFALAQLVLIFNIVAGLMKK